MVVVASPGVVAAAKAGAVQGRQAHPGEVRLKTGSTSRGPSAVLRPSRLAAARSGKCLLALRLPAVRSEAGRGRRCMGIRGMGAGIRMAEAGRLLVGEDFLSDSGLSTGGEYSADFQVCMGIPNESC